MDMSVAVPPAPVKRRYDASRRRDRAAENHQRVLDCAQRQFLADGYAATTVASIAAAAGMSPETIYKRFGGKIGLVRAIYERALAGQGSTPAPNRSDTMSAQDLDAAHVLRNWTRFSIEVAPRVSPIMLLVRAASATDPEARTLLDEMNAQRLTRMTHNARRLRARPGLRPRQSISDIRDVMFTYTAPELYEVLVIERGWSLTRYADFLYRGMAGQLLGH